MVYNFGNPNGMSIDEIIDLSSNEHFSKITCSLLPTIDYWKNIENRVMSLLKENDYKLCFEFPVKSIPCAKSSYTDLMIVSEKTNIAVESKWNEKIGQSCIKWRRTKERGEEVIKNWLGYISKYTRINYSLKEFEDIEYQILHRVASSCSLNKEKCVVLYQLFYEDNKKKDYIEQLSKMKLRVRSELIHFYIHNVKIEKKDKYYALEKEIKNRSKNEKVDLIKNTLKRFKLFSFDDREIYEITLQRFA